MSKHCTAQPTLLDRLRSWLNREQRAKLQPAHQEGTPGADTAPASASVPARGDQESQPLLTVEAAAPEAQPVTVARQCAPRMPRHSRTSPHLRCLQPTKDGTPCQKWAALLTPTTFASGCRFHLSDLEKSARAAALQELTLTA